MAGCTFCSYVSQPNTKHAVKKKKTLTIFCQQDCAYPQPSNNLQQCVCRLLCAKVSLNLRLQRQTSGKPPRNNVYFLSPGPVLNHAVSTMGSHISNRFPDVLNRWTLKRDHKTSQSWSLITCKSWNNECVLIESYYNPLNPLRARDRRASGLITTNSKGGRVGWVGGRRFYWPEWRQ